MLFKYNSRLHKTRDDEIPNLCKHVFPFYGFSLLFFSYIFIITKVKISPGFEKILLIIKRHLLHFIQFNFLCVYFFLFNANFKVKINLVKSSFKRLIVIRKNIMYKRKKILFYLTVGYGIIILKRQNTKSVD